MFSFRSPSFATRTLSRVCQQPISAYRVAAPAARSLLTRHFASLEQNPSSSPKRFAHTSASKAPEDSYIKNNLERHASLKDKIVDLGKFIDSCELCMVTTAKGNPPALVSRWFLKLIHNTCFCNFQEQAGVSLIFHTNTQSTKTEHLKDDPRVNISFLKGERGEWASISGDASVVTDRETIHKYYSSTLKPWFGDLDDGVHDGGPDDPRIGVIRVKTTQAAYAIVGDGMLGKDASQFTGSAKDVPRINKLRLLTKEELQEWRDANGTA
ncbi:cytochrome P450 [Penicillium malachiteum]|uniref:cytochrome P450 n=1 Tax=Penicillium malachiteum TaxID=1324776 RepID=UPI002548B0D9|nr:cytochrome P450 [Penicillium malachiteum]KAJ5737876.1 cytochrome P450 [Penicillium malachiteum]